MPFIFSDKLSDHFIIPKFVLFYTTALGLIIFGSISREKIRAIFSKSIFIVLLTCIATYLLSQFFYQGGSYRVVNYEFLCLLIFFAFSAYSQAVDESFLTKITFGNFMTLVFMLSIVVFKLATTSEEIVDLFFGDRNHFAEFLGISILLQLFHFKKLKSTFKLKAPFLIIVIIGATLVCAQTLCRSVILSLAICGAAYFLNVFVLPKIKENKIGLRFIIIALLSISALTISGKYAYDVYSTSKNHMVETKKLNSQLRLIRWNNTIEMIKENPLGVGPNNYEFSYMDYKNKKANDFELSETKLIKSPHNGYLELFAEYGVFVGVLFLVFLTMLFAKFWRLPNQFYFSVLLFFALDAIFAFPMELPFSSYAIAIFVGAGLVSSQQNEENKININLRPLSRSILIPFFVFTLIVIGSLITSVKYEDKIGSNLFCKLTPSVWRNCLDAGLEELSKSNFRAGSEILQKHLQLYPNNFVVLKYYAFSMGKIGEQKAACEALKKYDGFFAGQSTVNKVLIDQCGAY